MVFNPTLNADVAFNQPVQTPNAMEAVAGLFNFGAKQLMDEREARAAGTPKPTEDEKFAMTWKGFVAGDVGARDVTGKDVRTFIFKNPQFTSQAMALAESQGIITVTPQEVATKAAHEWFGTKEGMLAVAYAQGLPEEEQQAYLSEQVTKVAQQEAKLAELERNNAIYAAEGTLVTRQWDIMKPTAKDSVDHTVGAILNPILTDVINGVTVDIDPELKAQLGLRYDKIDMNNIGAVLNDAKISLEKQFRKSYSDSFGQDILPADDWSKEVFAGLDGLIKIGEAVKDPVARAATMKALIDTETYKTLDENGLAVRMRIVESMPPEIASIMIGDIAGFAKSFDTALAKDGKVFSTAGIKTSVSDMSKGDAEALANDVIKTFEHGIMPEFFVAFNEARKRSGYNVVDGESYKKIVSGNVKEITQLVSENPDFRAEFGDFLTSDIQQTISTIQSNLIAGVNLEFDGKQFIMVPEAGTLAAQKWNDPYRPYSKSAENQLPEDMNLSVLNEKIGALGLMGEFGKEIQGAVGILNETPKGEKKSAFGNGGRTTPRGRGRGAEAASDNFVVAGLIDRGYPQHIAEGFAMNIKDESNYNPTAVGDNGNAFGLVQWNGPRKRALETYAASVGADPADPDVQLDFIVHELETSESAAWSKIASTTTAGEAAAAIVNHYERPAEVHRSRREAAYLDGQSVGPAGAPVSTLPKEAQGATPTISLDSGTSMAQGASSGSPTQSATLSTGTLLTFESPEVQQLVESVRTEPEKAIAMAKEILTKPIDPSIKALIEALVKIGERA